MKKIFIIVSISALLSSCSMTAEQCDPSVDNGYFEKMGCTFSGAYADRVKSKELENEKLEKENALLLELNKQIEDQNTLLYGTVQDRAKSLDDIHKTLGKLEADLKAKNKLTDKLRSQIDNTRKTVGSMQNSNGKVLISKRQAELKKLNDENQNLNNLLLTQ